MNMYPPITSLHNYVSYQFSSLRARALRDQFLAKLTGTKLLLDVFPGKEERISPSRKLLGTQTIRVDQITGTLNRTSDFDRHFRPLKKHMLNRWVNAYVLRTQDAWAPIVVHKVGEQYFVEDGHHRVSVAHTIGMDFIEAKVWEYVVQGKPTETCQSTPCTKRRSSKAYAAG